MKYIKRSSNGIEVCDNVIVEYEKGLKEYINALCIDNLSTFKGREEASGVLLNRKSILPVYVNEDCVLFPTESIRNYDCIYINQQRVLSIQFQTKNETKVLFDDLSEIIAPVSKEKLARQLVRVECILEQKTS